MSTSAAPTQEMAQKKASKATSNTLSEADDFLARAQALGLRLTRADYERTRAGVTAFLKAERAPINLPGHADSMEDDRQMSSARDPDSSSEIEHEIPISTRIPNTHPNPDSAQPTSLSRWLRTTSGQLSFFTAVVEPGSHPSGDHRSRISLDEVGNAEERRRRRARRRKLLEKQMLLENQHGCVLTPAHDTDSLIDSQSPTHTIRASSVMSEPSTPTGTPAAHSIARTSTPVPMRGTDESLPACSSPMRSPEINVLNRMARVDHAGILWLAHRENHAEVKKEDTSVQYHDDSGVFCDADSSDSSSLLGWGPRAFTRTASSTTENLDDCMKSMSLLDRIMLRKSSPRRMRREAKAHARCRTETDDEGNLSTATVSDTSADLSTTSPWADQSQDSAVDDRELDVESSHAIAPVANTRSVNWRWSNHVSTPLKPSSMADQCDFVIEDISPEKMDAIQSSPSHERTAPCTSATPLTKLDPYAQITPMRYSPGYNIGYSHGRTTSLTSLFSPNILTPWSHQGRLMTNAGLANITSSPNLSGEWVHTSSMLHHGENKSSSNHFASPSRMLSQPFGEQNELPAHAPSPQRLMCIESFPGKSSSSHQSRRSSIVDESPTKSWRAQSSRTLSPLAHHRSAGTNAKTSPKLGTNSGIRPQVFSPTNETEMRPSLSPWYEPSVSHDNWDKLSFRRTDTIRPADLFHPAGSSSYGVSAQPTESREDRRFDPSADGPPLRRPEDDKGGSSRSRAVRKPAPMQRSSSTLVAMTPTYSDDLFAHTAMQTTDSSNAPVSDLFTDLNFSEPNQTEWEKPDGSRVVKLVSEELQAAIDSGTLQTEPTPRYFLLPPGHGRSKSKPSSVSYAGLIGQAILSSSDGRLSLAEIYLWISSVYPYYERGDRGWQNSIRHNLSLNKSFVKLERESSFPGKGGWWAIVPGHESRFQNGMYQPNATRLDAAATSSTASSTSVPAPTPIPGMITENAPGQASSSPSQDTSKKRQVAMQISPDMRDESTSDSSFKRPKTLHAGHQPHLESSTSPMRTSNLPNRSSSSGAIYTQGPVPNLTDNTDSPVTSPLQTSARDAHPTAASRTWRNEWIVPYTTGDPTDRSQAKPLCPTTSHYGPTRTPVVPSYVRSMHDVPAYPGMSMYHVSESANVSTPFTPSFQSPQRVSMRNRSTTMNTYPPTNYLSCMYPPVRDSS
ncbi:Forkhead transcription factor [Malassezia yamatoensis]|uniref:Forkhead transcription factor n=1 Tax=Malassezia yamatoensis TaxID=253288 RepID=A0AAJ5YRD2_9BASI|nr:Forkhead transcription factor [Malassezia yamatoensis]